MRCRWTSTWRWSVLWNLSGSSLIFDRNSWTSKQSCNEVNPGKYSTRIPLAHHQLCPKLCIVMNFWTTSTCPPRQHLIVGSRSSFQGIGPASFALDHSPCARMDRTRWRLGSNGVRSIEESRLPRTATATHGLRKTRGWRGGPLAGALHSMPAEASSAVPHITDDPKFALYWQHRATGLQKAGHRKQIENSQVTRLIQICWNFHGEGDSVTRIVDVSTLK